MTYNPYAAPGAGFGPERGGAAPGEPEPWTPSEVLSQSWSLFRTHWVYFVFPLLVVGFVQAIPGFALQGLVATGAVEPNSAAYWMVYAADQFFSQAMAAFFGTGLLRIHLQIARDEEPNFGLLFSGGDRFLPMFGMNLLLMLAVSAGMILCIVPGIILGIGLSLGKFFVADQGLGPIDALTQSWKITEGRKGDLFVLYLFAFLLVLLGLAACCIGVLATAPIYMVAEAIVYCRMTGLTARGSSPLSFRG